MKTRGEKWFLRLISVGLILIWGSATIPWVRLAQSIDFTTQLIAYCGLGLVTASLIGISFYVGALEEEVQALKTRNEVSEARADGWERQAQHAISVIENSLTRMLHKPDR